MNIRTSPISERHAPGQSIGANTSYPHLLRMFARFSLAAALCGVTALAAEGHKGLHPAPFLAVGSLLALAATCAFLAMLACATAQAVRRWYRR